MSNTTARESYSDWLQRKMQEGGFSQRSLARAWNPKNPESARRSLKRYLNGMTPHPRTRAQIAAVLGSKETGPADDDKEATYDPISDLRRRLAELSQVVEELAETA